MIDTSESGSSEVINDASRHRIQISVGVDSSNTGQTCGYVCFGIIVDGENLENFKIAINSDSVLRVRVVDVVFILLLL